MTKRSAKKKDDIEAMPPFLRAWFALTEQERWFIAGILLIALVGITARYFHLKGEKAEPYEPEGAGALYKGGTP
ncbi:MAG: hypothetical protein JXB04_02025 [Kiritimatiellae bacterium]|nr:hypothetical protein [Kiritimatiellia bacterium]